MKKLFLILIALLAFSCTTTVEDKYTSSDKTLNFPYVPEMGSEKPQTKLNPWEIWQPGKDMDGLPLANFNITNGDELSKNGDRAAALLKYQSIDKRRLLPQEQEALVFRVASSQLALKKPQDALNTLSDYFTKRNETIDFVDPAFCIILGYAYGYNNNIEQSLAWFSRVNKLNVPDRNFVLIAGNGAKSFLATVPQGSFEQTATMWASDDFIRNLIAEERAMRAQRGVLPPDSRLASQVPPPTGDIVNYSGVVNIGIILPLSGKYAVLGSNTRNGLEFALGGKHITDSKNQNLRLEMVYRDVGSAAGANSPVQLNELIGNVKPALIIGPLLSEEAGPAADLARQYKTPMITFSKKGVFQTGSGIFRLGATAQSQVESILSKVQDELRISQFALVYTNDANGQEFAEAYKREIPLRGGKIVYERSYNKDDSAAYLAIAQELEQYPVQAVLFPDNLLAASRFFANINPKKLSELRIIGTASWDDPAQIMRFSTILNGATYVSPFFANSQEENIKNFVSLYRAKFKSAPDFLAAQGYDTGVLVLNAFNTSYTQNIPFELALTRYQHYAGLTGNISVSPSGEIFRKFKIVEFRDGFIKELLTAGSPTYVAKGNEPAAIATATPVTTPGT